jgi:tetratricopeptide (TPR) repeat protein
MIVARSQLPITVAANIEHFTGRTWLLSEILNWIEQSDERNFLLTGGPGAGKSMILAWLAGYGPEPDDPEAQAQLRRLREQVAGAHFCQANSRNLSPQAFAESIANQLTVNVPGFREALAAILAERVQFTITQQVGTAKAGANITGVSIARLDLGALGDEISFDRAFTQPINKLYKSGYDKPLLLLVDSLDEAQTYTGQTNLAQLLAKLADLPPQVRILATTRPDPRVLMNHRHARKFDLIISAPPDDDDVGRYVAGRLAAASTGLNEAEQERLAKQVADKAAGIFLYAALVLDDLLPQLPAAADMGAYPLPDGLGAIYQGYLLREVGKDDALWYDLYEPLLGLIAVAQGEGLTATNLTALVRRDVRQALRASKQYLAGNLPDGPFRLFHKSFTDFLLEDESNIDRHIDAVTMHRRIADHYWEISRDGWLNCDDYGLNNMAVHLSSSGRGADLVNLIGPEWMQVRYERGGYTYNGFRSDIDVAWQAVLTAPSLNLRSMIHLQTSRFVLQERVNVYDDTDLEILVRLKRTDEALAHTRLRPDSRKQFDGFLTIYRAAAELKIPSQTIANDARGAANAIGDVSERAQALCSLAGALTQTSHPDCNDVLNDIKRWIRNIQSERSQAFAKVRLVRVLVQAGQLPEANRIAMEIENIVQKAWALEFVAIGLANSGLFGEAIEATKKIQTDWSMDRDHIHYIRVKALAGVAQALAKTSEEQATKLFDEAREIADSIAIDKEYKRAEAFHDLTNALVKVGRFVQARETADIIQGDRRPFAFHDLAAGFAEAGQFENARSLTDTIADNTWRVLALGSIAIGLSEAGRLKDALTIVYSFKNIDERVRGLTWIASALVKIGDKRFEGLINEAIELSGRIGKLSDRVGALRGLTFILLRANAFQQAINVFDQVKRQAAAIRDEVQFSGALVETAFAFAAMGDAHADVIFTAASRAIEMIQTFGKENVKRKHAENLIRVGRLDDARRVLASNWQDYLSVSVWCELAVNLARGKDARAQAAFDQARRVTDRMNEDSRVVELSKIATEMLSVQWFDSAEQVIALIERNGSRSEALCNLAVAIYKEDPQRAHTLFALAEQTARDDWIGSSQDAALGNLVFGLAQTRQFDEALRVVVKIVDDQTRVEALCRLGACLAMAGDLRGRSLLDEGLSIAGQSDLPDTWLEAKELRRKAAELARKKDAGAYALWAEAQAVSGSLWIGWFWQHPDYRAKALAHLGVALSQANDARADSVLEAALASAVAVPYENSRDETLTRLMASLIDIGRLEQAERAAGNIRGEINQKAALQSLIKAWISAGMVDQALRVARSFPIEYYRRQALREVAIAFSRIGKLTVALQVIEEVNLDEYLQTLAMTIASSTGAQRNEAVAAHQAAIGVAAWVRSDWGEIHEMLSTAEI